MKQIWAPWRIEFIKEKKRRGCVFCTLPKQKKDRPNLIVHRGESAFVILNKYPYNNGHLMVVPRQHTADLKKLDDKTVLETHRLVTLSIEALKKTMGAQGFNLGLNFSRAAGAGIEDHLHTHVVPRWVGDTNFMPILSDSKVMIEYLHETYDRLFSYFQKFVK